MASAASNTAPAAPLITIMADFHPVEHRSIPTKSHPTGHPPEEGDFLAPEDLSIPTKRHRTGHPPKQAALLAPEDLSIPTKHHRTGYPPADIVSEGTAAGTAPMVCAPLPPGIVLQTGLMNASTNALVCTPMPTDAPSGGHLDQASGVHGLLSGVNPGVPPASSFGVLALAALASTFWYRCKYQRAVNMGR